MHIGDFFTTKRSRAAMEDDEDECFVCTDLEPTPPAPSVPASITLGMDTPTAPVPLALPFPSDLPKMPKRTKGRLVGKYVTQGSGTNNYAPSVVYWNGKTPRPACWKGSCVHNPSFGFKDDAQPTRCKACRLPEMVDIRNKHVCPCGKQMHFGEVNDKRPSACKDCKTPTMINIVSKMCHCGNKMYFGKVDDQRPSACKDCRTSDMVDLCNIFCPCGKWMSFGEVNDKRPSACKDCKTSTMVNIHSKNKHCPCGNVMSFGEVNDKRPSACKNCKTITMVNIVSRMCKCGAHQPTFGYKDDLRPTRCADCKAEGMLDIITKKCLCGEGFAYYEDADGNKWSLCRSCAVAEGAHPESICGASYEACRFFCMLSRMTHKREDVPHVHWDRVSGEWNDFKEVKGLVSGRKIRPDGFLPDPSGSTKGVVYLFHGNRWHGYPPSHPKHEEEQVFCSKRTGAEERITNSDLYAKTEADTQAYLAAGYGAVEMWAHDFKEVERSNGLLQSLLVRRAPHPEA